MWLPIQVTGGVVRTRAARALEVGEMVTASNCRLKPGDGAQIHNDVGAQTFGTPLNDVVAGPFYLSFEGSTDKILVVTSDGADSYLETASVGLTGTFASIQTITGVVTAAIAVHRGDQYFVGTDQGNYVVQDNVSRAMGMVSPSAPITSASFTTADNAGSSAAAQDDVFTYFLTEYDSANDIESSARYLISDSISAATNEVEVQWTFVTPLNSNADKVRIYRHFAGNGVGETISNAYYADAPQAIVAGLVAEVDINDISAGTGDYTDDLLFILNPPVPYPLIQTDAIYGGAIYQFLVKPRDFTLGCVFNDCLVTNDPDTSKQIIRYSPPGYPEYQPDPYFMYFATERSDEVVGLRVINNRLIVLTTGSVHRVNYLPLAGDLAGQQGRVQEPITSHAGCVGRYAHAKVETEQGEFVVWLTTRGLSWSNGIGWGDACPDFDGELVTGSAPVLVNNERQYRLELYDGATRWDFYYHPSHLKQGRLKLMGPHTAAGTVSKGACGDQDYVWVAAEDTVYVVGTGDNAADSVLLTGHIKGQSPFSELACDGMAVTHSGTAGVVYTARVYGKLEGVAEQDTGEYTMPNPELDETGKMSLSQRGKYVRAQVTISGEAAWSAGPIYLEASVEAGADG